MYLYTAGSIKPIQFKWPVRTTNDYKNLNNKYNARYNGNNSNLLTK